jgi:hypothetical protein
VSFILFAQLLGLHPKGKYAWLNPINHHNFKYIYSFSHRACQVTQVYHCADFQYFKNKDLNQKGK